MCNQRMSRLARKLATRSSVGIPVTIWAVGALLLTGRPLPGATPAFDSAADPTYNVQPGGPTGWITGSSGGYGFGSWQAFNTPPGRALGSVGSSTTNGTGDTDNDGDINTPRNASGRAWALTAADAGSNGIGGSVDAVRPFDGPLNVGQTFTIDFDNGLIADPLVNGTPHPGNVSWLLMGGGTFGLQATGDSKDYFIFGGATRLDSGIPLTYEGLHCQFTPLGPSSISPFPLQWMMQVTPLFPGAQTYTFTGTRLGAPTEVDLTDGAAGTDPANAVYFNSISITDVPEPAAVGAVSLGAMLVLRPRRAGVRG